MKTKPEKLANSWFSERVGGKIQQTNKPKTNNYTNYNLEDGKENV